MLQGGVDPLIDIRMHYVEGCAIFVGCSEVPISNNELDQGAYEQCPCEEYVIDCVIRSAERSGTAR